MRWWQRSLILTALLAAAGPLGALSDPAVDEQEQNRQTLDRARQDPAHYAQLRRDLRAFLALAPEEQDRLRRLDRELHADKSAASARLRRALERYADWLEQLSTADRRALAGAPDFKARLQKIKEIRLKQWVERLPKAYRDQVHQATGEQRAALIRQFREEVKHRQQEWNLALRNWEELLQTPRAPSRLSDFNPAVAAFVNKNLVPLLSQAERDRLHAAEGKWPHYPQTLVELADKHLPTLPGPSTGPTHFEELPEEAQKALAPLNPGAKAYLRSAEGAWPDYAMKVTAMARRNNIRLPKQLGPSKPDEFAAPVRRFIHSQLLPVLDDDERKRLREAAGHWPRYPRTLVELERKHRLFIPGTFLPGPKEIWDQFRAGSQPPRNGLPD